MSDLKDYVDLKADELKLRTTKGLSLAMSRLAAMLLLVGLLVVVLALVAVVLIQWIGQHKHTPIFQWQDKTVSLETPMRTS